MYSRSRTLFNLVTDAAVCSAAAATADVAVDEPPADESDERLKRAGAADDLLLVLTHVVLSMLQVVTNAVALPVRKAKVVATSSTSR